MDKSVGIRQTAMLSTLVLVFFVFFLGILLNNSTGSDLYISEVCSHNNDIIHDSVGFYHDFIVLTNSSDEVIKLEGCALSDNNAELDRFVFPDIEIRPKEDLIIWADDPEVFGEDYADESAIFTGFRISDNEYLYLTDVNGIVTDSLRMPVTAANETLLRSKAGERGTVGFSGYMSVKPPVVSEMVSEPVLLAESGFYGEPFELTICAEYDVYYTVDGSSPYTEGVLYDAPVKIDDRSGLPDYYAQMGSVSAVYEQFYPAEPVSKATIVRAASRRPDGTFSKEAIATYFIGEEIKGDCAGTYTISIVSEPDGIFSYDRGIYVTGSTWDANSSKVIETEADPVYAPANYNMRGKGWRRGARITLFDRRGLLILDEDDVISIRGKSSRSAVQKGINIRSSVAGRKVLEGVIPDTGGTLMLRTGGLQDVFQTNFRDAINARISKNLKVGAQRSVCCNMYLDGEYWGCYNLQEHLDADFVESRYGIKTENVNLIKLDGEPEIPSGLTSDLIQYQDMESYVKEHDFINDEDYYGFCEMVDIDSLIDFYCAEIYFANDDVYLGNVAMWRSRDTGELPYEDGKWRWLLFDLDNTDGYAENAKADVDSFIDGSYAGYNACDDLYFSKLSNSKPFRARFRARFEELLSTDFSYNMISPILYEYEENYTAPMVMSVRRFYDGDFTEDEYHRNVADVRDFFRDRGKYISKYLALHMGD